MLALIENIISKLSPESKTFNCLVKKHKTTDKLIISWFEIIKEILEYLPKIVQFISYNELISQANESSRVNSLGFFTYDVLRKEVKLNWHHIEWINLVLNKDRLSIVASRDLGKTWFMTIAVFSWRMYRVNMKSENPIYTQNSGIIFSESSTLSESKLEKIKKIILENPILKNKLYPDKGEGKWTEERILTKNGFDLKAKGFDTATRGEHVFFILLDDIVKENAIYSKTYRTKLIKKFKEVILPIVKGSEGGQIININTPRHEDDLTGYIKKEMSNEWTHREYPAIFPNGQLCWAWKLPLTYLKKLRYELGEVGFNQEYLCRVINDGTSIFPYKILNPSKDKSFSYYISIEECPFWQNILYVTSGVDFAKSANVKADSTALISLAVTKNKEIFVIYAFNKQGMSYFEQLGLISDNDFYFKPDIIFLESNNFQKIYEESYADKFHFSKVKGVITGKEKNDYSTGIISIAILFERGLLHFPYLTEQDRSLTDLILSQFNSIAFTNKGLQSISGHDDLVFAFWKAKQAVDYLEGNFRFEVIEK